MSKPFPSTIVMEDFKIPLCIATASVGFGTKQSLSDKLDAISRAGFDGIELAWPDLVALAGEHAGHEIDPQSVAHQEQLMASARHVRALCRRQGLKIVMLQPFTNFEGWAEGSKEREQIFDKARLWIQVMEAVGTNMLQVGSTDSPNVSSDKQRLAEDIGQLADMLAAHDFYLCYENWCWATHCPSWASVWEIVKMASRPNVGLCLDTYQTAGGEWGDPTTNSGHIEGMPKTDLERMYEMSLKNLAATVPKEKIYILQVSDAYRMVQPLENRTDADGQRPRAQWSHTYRPMPYDGGYLPILPMAKAVLGTGFHGWWSLEVFDGGETGKGQQRDMNGFTEKGIGSLRRFLQEAGATDE